MKYHDKLRAPFLRAKRNLHHRHMAERLADRDGMHDRFLVFLEDFWDQGKRVVFRDGDIYRVLDDLSDSYLIESGGECPYAIRKCCEGKTFHIVASYSTGRQIVKEIDLR